MSRDGWIEMKIKLVLVIIFLLFHASLFIPQAAAQQDPAKLVPRARVIVFVHGLHGSR
jgi:hypothetical protein